VIRLKISAGAPPALRDTIMAELGVTADEVVEVAGLLGLTDLRELVTAAAAFLAEEGLGQDVPASLGLSQGASATAAPSSTPTARAGCSLNVEDS
jgi:polyphosphate kinase